MGLGASCFLGRHSGSGFLAEYNWVGSHHRIHNGNHKGTPGNHAEEPAALLKCPIKKKKRKKHLLTPH